MQVWDDRQRLLATCCRSVAYTEVKPRCRCCRGAPDSKSEGLVVCEQREGAALKEEVEVLNCLIVISQKLPVKSAVLQLGWTKLLAEESQWHPSDVLYCWRTAPTAVSDASVVREREREESTRCGMTKKCDLCQGCLKCSRHFRCLVEGALAGESLVKGPLRGRTGSKSWPFPKLLDPLDGLRLREVLMASTLLAPLLVTRWPRKPIVVVPNWYLADTYYMVKM